jgi:cobalt-zinc-cadmium efflux system membrane fusion protein
MSKARSQFNLTAVPEKRLANLIKDKAMSQKDWDEAQANLVAARSSVGRDRSPGRKQSPAVHRQGR